MSRPKPNISMNAALYKADTVTYASPYQLVTGRATPEVGAIPVNDKATYHNIIVDVLIDTFIREYHPDTLEVIDGLYFKLTFLNKKLMTYSYEVGSLTDYIDVYIYSVKQPSNRYAVSQVGNDLVILFIADITHEPIEVLATDFIVRAKWQI